MIKLNELFQITNNDEKHVVVDGNFYTVKNAPKPLHHYEWSDFPNSLEFLEVADVIPDPVITPKGEQLWVKSEFENFVDPIVMMFWSGDTRANAYVEQEIKTYSNQLRDYVTEHNGELHINGDRPPRPEKHIKTKSKK